MSSLKNLFARRMNQKTQTLTKKITGDNLKESSTSSPLEVIPDITEFTDISPKDSTLNLLEVNSIITESVVFFEDLPDKLLLTRDIQHAIELIPGANLPDLSHSRLDPTKQTELKGQVDELSLEVNQLCLVPIDIHLYEDKFLSYVLIKDVGQIKNVTIYGRAMSDNSINAIMRGSSITQIINFSSLTVKQRVAFQHILIPLVLIVTIL